MGCRRRKTTSWHRYRYTGKEYKKIGHIDITSLWLSTASLKMFSFTEKNKIITFLTCGATGRRNC
jgi:hypothetical protein